MRGTRDWLPGVPALPRIDGGETRLRPIVRADREAVFALFSDAAVMRYWSRPPMREPREAEAYVDEVAALFAQREMMNWAIARRADDALVGTCTLLAINREHRGCEIGFSLASRYWGRGWAREATTLAIGFAFDALQLERIEADIDPRNAASIRLVERLGFVREGLLRARWRVGGEVQDSAIFGLLRAEFRPLR